MGLTQVTQDKGESLREYMSQFNRATLGIKNLQMSSVITVLLSRLRNHGFRASLLKKPVDLMTELLRQGEEYIDQEEIQLNAPLSIILREISALKELQWPERLRSDPSIRDHSRRCESHKDHGHTTDQYRTLRSEVERFGQSFTFNDGDQEGVSLPHDDALVITGDIADFDVKRVLVDTGSAANVMCWKAFKGLKIPTNRLNSINTPLQGFGGGTVIPEGIVDLLVVLGKHPYSMTLITLFLIVCTPMAYNSIYGRPIINSAGAIISTQHQCMKFSTSRRIEIVRGDQLTSRRCYVDSIRHEADPIVLTIEKNEFQQTQRFEPAEEVEVVEFEEGKKVVIGRSLNEVDRMNLLKMLRENIEVFAWGTDDLLGVDPSIAQHRLNNMAGFKPVTQ
ncbi:Ribonuclease H [Abeliophyllum distichum]|uniref:Ribonuclease H n=1 Tax=Abeliophyllum distichum TaxID=126358 RepID=A0ABD1VZ65_9LAMI